MFANRIEAGLILAQHLKKYKNSEGLVLAIPRGGVPVAYSVAKELGLPVDLIFTKKIGHPFNKEYAIGAASLSDYFIIPHEDVSESYVQQELKNVRARLKDMYKKIMGETEPQNLKGKTVLLIDDGIATGNTLLATIKLLRKSKPGKLVVAVPVAPDAAIQKLSKEVDEIVTVITPVKFRGVGAFYQDFSQVTDEEVMLYLGKLNKPDEGVWKSD